MIWGKVDVEVESEFKLNILPLNTILVEWQVTAWEGSKDYIDMWAERCSDIVSSSGTV